MAAHDPRELSHIIHRSGGVPVASVSTKPEYLPRGAGKSDEEVYYDIAGPTPPSHINCPPFIN